MQSDKPGPAALDLAHFTGKVPSLGVRGGFRRSDEFFSALCHCRGFLKQHPLFLPSLVATRVLRRPLAPQLLPSALLARLTFDFGGKIAVLLVESPGVHERAEGVAVGVAASKGHRRRLCRPECDA